MNITRQQAEAFEDAARPLVRWLRENCPAHVTAIVTPVSVELAESVCGSPMIEVPEGYCFGANENGDWGLWKIEE